MSQPSGKYLHSKGDGFDESASRLHEQSLEIRLLRQQCDSLQAEIESLKASNSWRLTKPLRAMTSLLRAMAARRARPVSSSTPTEQRLPAAGSVAMNIPEVLPAEDSFAFYRILGNDLYPRHKKGQTLDNLRFILEHEPDFEGCEKRFVLNRILDESQEQHIVALLEEYGHSWIRIPFHAREYRNIGLDMSILPEPGFLSSPAFQQMDESVRDRFVLALCRRKINYLTNNNGARNAALEDGRARARWVLPWDGNCFLSQRAWDAVRNDMLKAPDAKYFIVPMARMLDNQPLIDGGVIPEAVEEPQILFRSDAVQQFDPAFCYGQRDKVELLWRLGAQGSWSEYHDDPWDLPRPRVAVAAGEVSGAGWVARLFSGMPALETSTDLAVAHRGFARSMAIRATLEQLDVRLDAHDDLSSFGI